MQCWMNDHISAPLAGVMQAPAGGAAGSVGEGDARRAGGAGERRAQLHPTPPTPPPSPPHCFCRGAPLPLCSPINACSCGHHTATAGVGAIPSHSHLAGLGGRAAAGAPITLQTAAGAPSNLQTAISHQQGHASMRTQGSWGRGVQLRPAAAPQGRDSRLVGGGKPPPPHPPSGSTHKEQGAVPADHRSSNPCPKSV